MGQNIISQSTEVEYICDACGGSLKVTADTVPQTKQMLDANGWAFQHTRLNYDVIVCVCTKCRVQAETVADLLRWKEEC